MSKSFSLNGVVVCSIPLLVRFVIFSEGINFISSSQIAVLKLFNEVIQVHTLKISLMCIIYVIFIDKVILV